MSLYIIPCSFISFISNCLPIFPDIQMYIHTATASMVVGDQLVLCKAVLVFAVARWLLSFALNLLTSSKGFFSASSDSSTETSPASSCCPSTTSKSANLRMVRENISVTTLGNIRHRLPESRDSSSCAVCLNRLRKSSLVWELRNCCHVFHKHCLERWLAYDNHLTCPLCRACLIPASPLPPYPRPDPPRWAVERMLYLFGDDLLP